MILEINRFVDPIINLLGDNFGWLSELTIGSIIVRLVLVILFSGIIGIERASKKHEAGLRTYILVCVGSAVAMITNQFIFEAFGTGDVGRIASQVISGIGFLGAGTILITSRNQIKGLTTAACLWTCACMGLAIGIGFYTLTIIGFALIIIVLVFLNPIEKYFLKFGSTYSIHVELLTRTDLKELINLSRNMNMKILSIERNAAYANSGLSVYTINFKKLEKNEENSHFLQTIKDLPYVNYVEELK